MIRCAPAARWTVAVALLLPGTLMADAADKRPPAGKPSPGLVEQRMKKLAPVEMTFDARKLPEKD